MVKKIVKSTLRPFYKLMINALQSAENHIIQESQEPLYSPIFIIGVPRSGTTLLYQAMIHSLDVCYFSNLMAKYYHFPCIFSYLLSSINGHYEEENFESYYGEVSGWKAPSQAHLFWARWFPGEDQNYVGLDEISNAPIKELRNTILLLQKIYKRPFTNKALSLGVRILPLFRAFPESLFVRIHRDHLDSAQSILKGRLEYAGDKNRWISTKPSNYDRIKHKEYITQVCGQIYYIEKDMDKGIHYIGKNRCLDVHYKDLCKNPRKMINEIQQFYNQNTCKGTIRKRQDLPPFFDYSEGKKCCDDDYKELRQGLCSFFGVV